MVLYNLLTDLLTGCWQICWQIFWQIWWFIWICNDFQWLSMIYIGFLQSADRFADRFDVRLADRFDDLYGFTMISIGRLWFSIVLYNLLADLLTDCWQIWWFISMDLQWFSMVFYDFQWFCIICWQIASRFAYRFDDLYAFEMIFNCGLWFSIRLYNLLIDLLIHLLTNLLTHLMFYLTICR